MMGTPCEVPVPKKRNANDIIGDCEWSASDVKARPQVFDRDLELGEVLPRLMGFSAVLRRKFCNSMLQVLLRTGTTVGSAAGNPSMAESTPGEPTISKAEARGGWMAASGALSD